MTEPKQNYFLGKGKIINKNIGDRKRKVLETLRRSGSQSTT